MVRGEFDRFLSCRGAILQVCQFVGYMGSSPATTACGETHSKLEIGIWYMQDCAVKKDFLCSRRCGTQTMHAWSTVE
jgi:hypothetical protein